MLSTWQLRIRCESDLRSGARLSNLLGTCYGAGVGAQSLASESIASEGDEASMAGAQWAWPVVTGIDALMESLGEVIPTDSRAPSIAWLSTPINGASFVAACLIALELLLK